MQVRCTKEFHSKISPGTNYGVLGKVYYVEAARYSVIWDGEVPVHYKLHGLDEWVNTERFEVVPFPHDYSLEL